MARSKCQFVFSNLAITVASSFDLLILLRIFILTSRLNVESIPLSYIHKKCIAYTLNVYKTKLRLIYQSINIPVCCYQDPLVDSMSHSQYLILLPHIPVYYICHKIKATMHIVVDNKQ